MGKIIGIDLGTTNSLVAVWENGESVLIPNSLGSFLTPSVVSFDEDGTVYVGEIAKERLTTHPFTTVASFKRNMGTRYRYEVWGKEYKPEELSALVLKKLKEDAENYLGEPVEEAVISVPAYFNDMARTATKNAGALAGLKVDRIINEPSAAALACQERSMEEEANILVFDFGGGTLDVSLVECFDNVIEIVAISGDNKLGGNDFDEAIAMEFCRKNGIEYHALSAGEKSVLQSKANQCKLELTDSEEAEMTADEDGIRGQLSLNRKELIAISSELFLRMELPVKRVLSDWGHRDDSLHRVVMVGGSCKMPIVQYFLEHLLGDYSSEVLDPDHMIAKGMGVYAGIKERDQDVKDMLLTDICPFSLGTAVHNKEDPRKPFYSVIIERNTALPASRENIYRTMHDNQRKVGCEIYQGEEFYAENNLLLGKVMVKVPPAPKGEESISIRYTYDINGILIVDIKVNSTGETTQKVIVSEETSMTEKELQSYMKKLEALKIHPRDKEENKLLFAKGERLYQSAVGLLRDDIGDKMKYYEFLLGKQDEFLLSRWRKTFHAYLDEVEAAMGIKGINMKDAGDFAAWYEKRVESRQGEEEKDAMRVYQTWKGKNLLN